MEADLDTGRVQGSHSTPPVVVEADRSNHDPGAGRLRLELPWGRLEPEPKGLDPTRQGTKHPATNGLARHGFRQLGAGRAVGSQGQSRSLRAVRTPVAVRATSRGSAGRRSWASTSDGARKIMETERERRASRFMGHQPTGLRGRGPDVRFMREASRWPAPYGGAQAVEGVRHRFDVVQTVHTCSQ